MYSLMQALAESYAKLLVSEIPPRDWEQVDVANQLIAICAGYTGESRQGGKAVSIYQKTHQLTRATVELAKQLVRATSWQCQLQLQTSSGLHI